MTDPSLLEPEGATSSFAAIMSRIANAMAHGAISPGDLADLRRVSPESPDRPAFWRILHAWVSPAIPPDQESPWAVVLSGLARLAPTGHRRHRRLGEALATAGYSEGRLLKLLRTRTQSPTFHAIVRRTCAFLAAKAEPIDWAEFATFVLVADADKAEELRRNIARDYYSKANQEANS